MKRNKQQKKKNDWCGARHQSLDKTLNRNTNDVSIVHFKDCLEQEPMPHRHQMCLLCGYMKNIAELYTNFGHSYMPSEHDIHQNPFLEKHCHMMDICNIDYCPTSY